MAVGALVGAVLIIMLLKSVQSINIHTVDSFERQPAYIMYLGLHSRDMLEYPRQEALWKRERKKACKLTS